MRAAVFAAVCVLLASLGHVMMSGTAVPWWALVAGAVATGGAAWWLARRERGPLLIGSGAVGAQAVLHSSFSFAQAVVHPQTSGGRSLTRQWLGYVLCGSPSGSATGHDTMATSTGSMGSSMNAMSSMDSMGSMDHAMSALHSMGSMDHMGAAYFMGSTGHTGAAHSLDHAVGRMSSTGMLAAHLLAALLCGLWLGHGERAAFRILRAFAGWLVAPLRLILRLPAPPHRPRVRARRGRSDRTPRRLLLTHAITSRGPPTGTAVA